MMVGQKRTNRRLVCRSAASRESPSHKAVSITYAVNALRSAALAISLIALGSRGLAGQAAAVSHLPDSDKSTQLTRWDITPYVLVDGSVNQSSESRLDANPTASAVYPESPEIAPARSTEQEQSLPPRANWHAVKPASLPATLWGPQRALSIQPDEPPTSPDLERPGSQTEASPEYSSVPLVPETTPPAEIASQAPVPPGHKMLHDLEKERLKLAQQRSLKGECAAMHLSPPECRLRRYQLGNVWPDTSRPRRGQSSRQQPSP